MTNVYGNGSCEFTNGYPAQNSNAAAGCMSNGDLWTVEIGYDGSALSLQIQEGDAAPDTIYAALPIDIATALGTNQA